MLVGWVDSVCVCLKSPAWIRRMISISRSERTTSRSLYISKMVRCNNDHHIVV